MCSFCLHWVLPDVPALVSHVAVVILAHFAGASEGSGIGEFLSDKWRTLVSALRLRVPQKHWVPNSLKCLGERKSVELP